MNDRTCIVTRRQAAPDELIRFVLGPDGAVVPDLKRKLPGRGCWVTAERRHVDEAARKKRFREAFRKKVAVPADLGGDGRQRSSPARRSARWGWRARRARWLSARPRSKPRVRSGAALLVLHAVEASEDGVRKIAQASRATARARRPGNRCLQTFFGGRFGFGIGRHKCDTCCRSRGGRGKGGSEAHGCA